MKRSKSIKLVLLAGVSAGALTGCDSSQNRRNISTENVYTNDYHVAGLGYYHAPFRAWYPLPYNHFDPQKASYFYGGIWAPTPFQTITNISSPTPEAVRRAQAVASSSSSHVYRGGFGHSSWSHSSFHS